MERPASRDIGKIDLHNHHNKLLIIDIDGVLAIERNELPLEERTPVCGARESMRLLKEKGYKIILCTSRSCRQKKETIQWLEKNGILFDDIVFGKPRGILYIDDRAYRFKGWKEFFDDVEL